MTARAIHIAYVKALQQTECEETVKLAMQQNDMIVHAQAADNSCGPSCLCMILLRWLAPQDPSGGQPAFLCLLWLVGGLLALGTSSGDILICHEGALRARLSTSHASRAPGPAALSVQNGVAVDGIHALATKGRGFVAAGSRGEVYFFEPPDRAVGRG